MDKKSILAKPTAYWAEGSTCNDSISVSSRIRLARNLADQPFPNILTSDRAKEIAQEISQKIEDKFLTNASLFYCDSSFELSDPGEALISFDMAELKKGEGEALFEKHLVSQDLLNNPMGRYVVINPEQSISVMINEEDHLRLQCILPGSHLKEAWSHIFDLDNILAEDLPFAFDENLGFLTACPSNVGTGLRASVMLHLPALVMTNKLEAILQQLYKVGLTVRGVYGEGSKSYGHLYQISNQISLGFSESDIISRLQSVVDEIVMQERTAREWLMQNNQKNILDYIWRSYGILSNARLITNQEVMEQISIMRLGVDLALFDNLDTAKLNRLMINCQPVFLSGELGEVMTPEARDWARAKIVREYLQN